MIEEPSPDIQVWLDGAFTAWRDARAHVTAHHYGFGAFEGLRAYRVERGTAIFRLQDHTARLFRSLRILNIEVPHSAADLEHAQREVVRRNDLGDAYLRPFVFLEGALGIGIHTHRLAVRTAIVALPWTDDGAHHARSREGIRLQTSSYRRHAPSSLLSKAKANGNYMTSILALAEARAAGVEDAILLDSEGFVTEATGANVFAVVESALHTPPREVVLEGITRDSVFTLAREIGLEVVERRLTRDELYGASEVFLTGTAAEITAVTAIDGRSFGPRPVTQRLAKLYADVVRGNGGHSEWLTLVERSTP